MLDKILPKKIELVTFCAYIAFIILALVPFHAILTVWLSSIFGHYTLFRLWEEYLLVICLFGCLWLLTTDKSLRKKLVSNKLFWLIIAYLAVQVIWGIVANQNHDVNKKALAYGLLLNCRYLIFFLITWTLALKTQISNRISLNIVLWPAVIVIVFGLLQIFILPNDFLNHFGYGSNTIPSYETINGNSHFVRIASTLRGANPLGAYIVIPLSLISVLIIKGRRSWQKIGFLIAGLIVLVFSFSRSAWLGATAAFAASIYLSVKSAVVKRNLLYLLALVLVILAGLAFALRNNVKAQNIIWHTQSHSAVKITSDEGHASALTTGLKQMLAEPLGRGPGSAGPASVYNNHQVRIAENYYVQIGQETGWLGLLLFIAINAYIVYLLYLRRSDNLALALLASIIGIFIVNMLSHAWSDDTLAYLWWGLAGIAFAKTAKK